MVSPDVPLNGAAVGSVRDFAVLQGLSLTDSIRQYFMSVSTLVSPGLRSNCGRIVSLLVSPATVLVRFCRVTIGIAHLSHPCRYTITCSLLSASFPSCGALLGASSRLSFLCHATRPFWPFLLCSTVRCARNHPTLFTDATRRHFCPGHLSERVPRAGTHVTM